MESICLTTSLTPITKTPTRSGVDSQTNQSKKDQKSENDRKSRSLIETLLDKIPQIDEVFTVHKKIGEGTFGNVFVASPKSLQHKRKYAIKHLTPTSLPSRILQEMRCLKDIGGRDNVVNLELCFRNKDAVAFVMPYFPHDSFSNYVTKMTSYETQIYVKNLLIALQRVHSFNIIHRDVKPSNFLYNRAEKKFLLVDFGLSHPVNNEIQNDTKIVLNYKKRVRDPFEKDPNPSEHKRPVLHSLSNNVPEKSILERSGQKSVKKRSPPFKENSPISKNSAATLNINQVKRNLQFGNITTEVKKNYLPLLNQSLSQSLASKESSRESPSVKLSSCGSRSNIKSQFSIGAGSVIKSQFRKPFVVKTPHTTLMKFCGCDSKPKICNHCIMRKPMQAPRAGTPGYRSPEVLLKYPHQTTAVDIWSTGVIMLSILSGSYPFFRAPDDISALMEIITIFGTDELKNTAKKLGRFILCSETRKPLSLFKLCERLRKRHENDVETDPKVPSCMWCMQKILPNEGCICKEKLEDSQSFYQTIPQVFPNEAYDLLTKLLTVDPTVRCTAQDALDHPFFKMNLLKN